MNQRKMMSLTHRLPLSSQIPHTNARGTVRKLIRTHCKQLSVMSERSTGHCAESSLSLFTTGKTTPSRLLRFEIHRQVTGMRISVSMSSLATVVGSLM